MLTHGSAQDQPHLHRKGPIGKLTELQKESIFSEILCQR